MTHDEKVLFILGSMAASINTIGLTMVDAMEEDEAHKKDAIEALVLASEAIATVMGHKDDQKH